MGPRSVERGKQRPASWYPIAAAASMGPRLVERGKHRQSPILDLDGKPLQWGRARLSAESGAAE